MQKLERYIRQYTMSEEQPWLLQTFLQGPEYSCYTLAHKGQVVAHVDNLASLSCLNYAHVGVPEVTPHPSTFFPSRFLKYSSSRSDFSSR